MPRLKLVQALKRNLFSFWLLGLVPMAILGRIAAVMIAPGLDGSGGMWINPVQLFVFACYFFFMPLTGYEKQWMSPPKGVEKP